jgi:hypothetical protein
MSDPLRSSLLKIAHDLPTGDPARREILAALRDKEAANSSWRGVHRTSQQKGSFRVQLIRWGLGSTDLKDLARQQDIVLTDTDRLVKGYGPQGLDATYRPMTPPVHDASAIKKTVGILVLGPWVEVTDVRKGKQWGPALANILGYKAV